MDIVLLIPQPSKGLSSLWDWAKEVLSKQILHGFLIEDVEAAKTGKVITHRLGRAPRGAIIVKGGSFVALSEFTKTTITAYGSSTVSIWIF